MKKLLTFLALCCLMVTGAWAQYNVTVGAPVDISSLAAGSQTDVLMYAGGDGKYGFIHVSNNRFTIDTSFNGASAIVDNAYFFKLVKNNDGTVSVKTSDGKYLPGFSSTSALGGYGPASGATSSYVITFDVTANDNTTNNVTGGNVYTLTSHLDNGAAVHKNSGQFQVSNDEAQIVPLQFCTYTSTAIVLPVKTVATTDDLDNATWYQLNVRNKYVKYDAGSNSYYDTFDDRPVKSDLTSFFAFVGNEQTGYKIVNRSAGFDKAMGADNANTNTRLKAVDFAAARSYGFKAVTINGNLGWQLYDMATPAAYLNQQGTNLGYWQGGGNGDIGNAFVFTEVEYTPVSYPQEGHTYYIYNANWNNNTAVQYYLHPSGTGLDLSTKCYEEPAYMWTCVKNGDNYNFRNVGTGQWLSQGGMSNNAYNFTLAEATYSEGCLTIYSVNANRYMVVNNAGTSIDKYDHVANKKTERWSCDYGFTECSVGNLYFSESLASDKVKWLRVANCSNTGYVMTVKDDDTAGSTLHTAGTDAAAEGQLFAFVGSRENGFVIYNKKLGNTYTLTAANTNEGTAATWVLNAETPTKWYLDESQLNASSQPGYGITTSSTSGGRSLNMWAGDGGDAKFYANGAGNGGSRWQFSLVDGTPTVIHYVVSGTKAHNDANNYVGVLNITKGTFLSNTYVGTDVNGKTFNAYLPKTQEPISISNTKLHGWNYSLTGSDGNYTVTYTTEQTDYQYLAFDKSAQWYRIPAIAKASNGDLVAIYDYRVCHNDVGFGEVDQVMRRSTDGGVTWSEETKIADGNGGGNHFGAAYGDPALVADRESNNMTLITVSGQQSYPGATATSRPMVAALFSSDNGQHWSDPVDITSQFWGSKGAMFQDETTEAEAETNGTQFAYSGFFGSGKILQSRKYKFGEAHRLYAAMLCRGRNVKGAYVVYSDDMGDTWHLLGGDNSIQAAPDSDEPKVEELPNGDIVLSCRKSYGRYFNVWHWSTEPTSANTVGAGTWGSQIDSNSGSITKGIRVGANSCNGEILYVEATKVADGTSAKLMLQSLPAGGGRSDVEIWYKDITDPASYATSEAFASNWERGKRVSTTSSAYSTMTVQKDGKIGFFYEEGPATYCMVYVPLTIEKITNNAYEKVVEDIPTAEISLDNTTVTSSQLSELTITFTGDNAAQVQLSTENHTAYLTPKTSTPAQVKAQNGKFKAAPAGAIEGNISATDETGKFSINFGDADIAAGDYELSIPEGTFLVGTTPVPELKANYTVEEPAPIPTAGRVYTIKANFPDQYTDLYLAHNGSEKLQFNTTATDVTNYWVARASGEERPWKFQSGYGDGNYLDGNSNNAISTTGAAYNVESSAHGFHMQTNLTGISYAGLRYIGTWESGTKSGYGKYNGAYGNNDNYGQWTTHYEIEPVPNVTVYDVVCETTDGGVAPKFSNYAGVATVKDGGIVIVPNGTTLDATNFPAAEISGYTGSVTFNGTTITVTYEASATPDGFHIYESNGTYSNVSSTSVSFKDKWTSTQDAPRFEIFAHENGNSNGSNNMKSDATYANSGIVCYSGKKTNNISGMTVSIPTNGYVITGYSFKVKNYDTGDYSITVSAGESSVNTSSENKTISVSGLSVSSFEIIIDGSNGSLNKGVVLTDFYVTYAEGEHDVEVPATGYYYIKENGQYLYNDFLNHPEATQSIATKQTYDNGYVWKVTSIEGSTTVTLLNGEGSGYKANAGAEEETSIDLTGKNWTFEAFAGYDPVPVIVQYAILGDYVPFQEPWMTYETHNSVARNGGFFAFPIDEGERLERYGYSTNVIGQPSPDGTNWVGARLFNHSLNNHRAAAYYYSQQDVDRYADVVLKTYQVLFEHIGEPGYCTEQNEDFEDEGTFNMLNYLAWEVFMGMEFSGWTIEEAASLTMEPYEAKYYLGKLNDYIKSLTIAPPVMGDAYHIAVRGNDYTGNTKYYLKNDGTYTTNEAEADVFVLGGSGDATCGSLLVTNNNPGTEGGIHYLQVREDGVDMNTEYKETDNALNLVSMTKAEGENVQSCPAYLYGTFSATNKDGKVLTFDETGDGSWISDAESLYMKDNKTSAIELISVPYPYNKPNFVKGNPDDHEGGYASIWLPFPMKFSDGIEVYKGTTNYENLLILEQVNTDEVVAAGGYILRDPNQTENKSSHLVLPAPGNGENMKDTKDEIQAFVGSTENPEVVKEATWADFKANYSGTPYVLANKSAGIGFYKYSDSEIYLPKGKAIWFAPTTNAETVQFSFGDIVEAIKALNGEATDAEIYDLQGHRLNKAVKGQVNVINGKKVMFK